MVYLIFTPLISLSHCFSFSENRCDRLGENYQPSYVALLQPLEHFSVVVLPSHVLQTQIEWVSQTVHREGSWIFSWNPGCNPISNPLHISSAIICLPPTWWKGKRTPDKNVLDDLAQSISSSVGETVQTNRIF